jgi:hypothetical protein
MYGCRPFFSGLLKIISASILQSVSTLTGFAKATHNATAALAALATVTAPAKVARDASASLAVQASLSAIATVSKNAIAALSSQTIFSATAIVARNASAALVCATRFHVREQHFGSALLRAVSTLTSTGEAELTGCRIGEQLVCRVPGFSQCFSSQTAVGFGYENTEAIVPAMAACLAAYGEYLKTLYRQLQHEAIFEDQEVVTLSFELPQPLPPIPQDFTDRLNMVRERLLTAEQVPPTQVPVYGLINHNIEAERINEKKMVVDRTPTIEAVPQDNLKDLAGRILSIKERKARLLAEKEKIRSLAFDSPLPVIPPPAPMPQAPEVREFHDENIQAQKMNDRRNIVVKPPQQPKKKPVSNLETLTKQRRLAKTTAQ